MAVRSADNQQWLILELDSSTGRKLDNYQSSEEIPANVAAAADARYRREHLGLQSRTTVCTNGYNCHGLVFAGRRTCIDDPSTVRQILADDSYRRVNRDELLAGDVALYVVKGAIEHSGIVVDKGARDDRTGLWGDPLIVSKWG